MNTFTTTLPPDDPFGTEPLYVVIHPEKGEIWSPCSARQILADKYGFAARGGYLWAKRSPDMAKAISTPQNAGNDGLVAHIAKLEEQVAARDTAMSAARKAMVAAQDGLEKAWEALA
jgi:hypothetical protein